MSDKNQMGGVSVEEKYYDYVNKSSVVKGVEESLFNYFKYLDRLHTAHKLLGNEVRGNYLLVANLTGLDRYASMLLKNYGGTYTKLGDYFKRP